MRQFLTNTKKLIEEKAEKFNLFQSYSSSLLPSNKNYQYYEILSTRLYLLTFILLLFIFTFYTTLINRTLIVIIKSPTLKQYETLYEKYSETLTCSCTQISIPYEKFIYLSPIYHQVCSSQFITDKWFEYINDNTNYGISFETLCQSTNQTIQESIIVFYLTQLVNDKLIPEQLFQIQINSYIQFFISTTTSTYNRSLQILEDTIQVNGLLASGTNVEFFSPQYLQSVLIIPNIYYDQHNQSCSCTNTDKCIQQIKLYNYLIDDDYTTVNGLYCGCYIVNSLLQSTLECFYDDNPTCFEQLNLILSPISNQRLNFSLLNSTQNSLYQSNTTIEQIVDNLMVEQWNPLISYQSYFNECNPDQCTYTYVKNFDYIYTITTILGLIGGLNTVLKILIPKFVIISCFYILPFTKKLNWKSNQ
ncbi:unnamed protein product, partial [Didymodactylos carnosus]